MIISFVATLIILAVSFILFDVVVKGSFAASSRYYTHLSYRMFGARSADFNGSLIPSKLLSCSAVILTMLPTFLLSGFVFPIRNMPVIIQAITYFDSLHDIFSSWLPK